MGCDEQGLHTHGLFGGESGMTAIQSMTLEQTLSGLQETLFFLAIECYSTDEERQKKVERMAISIHHAIERLKGEEK